MTYHIKDYFLAVELAIKQKRLSDFVPSNEVWEEAYHPPSSPLSKEDSEYFIRILLRYRPLDRKWIFSHRGYIASMDYIGIRGIFGTSELREGLHHLGEITGPRDTNFFKLNMYMMDENLIEDSGILSRQTLDYQDFWQFDDKVLYLLLKKTTPDFYINKAYLAYILDHDLIKHFEYCVKKNLIDYGFLKNLHRKYMKRTKILGYMVENSNTFIDKLLLSYFPFFEYDASVYDNAFLELDNVIIDGMNPAVNNEIYSKRQTKTLEATLPREDGIPALVFDDELYTGVNSLYSNKDYYWKQTIEKVGRTWKNAEKIPVVVMENLVYEKINDDILPGIYILTGTSHIFQKWVWYKKRNINNVYFGGEKTGFDLFLERFPDVPLKETEFYCSQSLFRFRTILWQSCRVENIHKDIAELLYLKLIQKLPMSNRREKALLFLFLDKYNFLLEYMSKYRLLNYSVNSSYIKGVKNVENIISHKFLERGVFNKSRKQSGSSKNIRAKTSQEHRRSRRMDSSIE